MRAAFCLMLLLVALRVQGDNGGAAAAQTPATAVAPAAAEPGAPPPPDAFFGMPDVVDARISPDGTHLAFLTRRVLAGRMRQCLAVVDLASRKLEHEPFYFEEGRMANVLWVNDRRLIFHSTIEQSESSQGGGGVYAIDRDGSNLRALISSDWHFHSAVSGSSAVVHILPPEYAFKDVILDGSDDVIVFRRKWDNRGLVTEALPFRLNTRTGHVTGLGQHAPDHTVDWLLDRKGEPRFAETEVDGVIHVYERDAGSGQWTEFAHFHFLSPDRFDLWQLGFDNDIYTVAHKGKDTAGIYLMDPATHRIADERVVNIKGFDFRGWLHFDFTSHRILGVHYVADAAGTVWLDKGMEAIQKRVDGLLPATINTILCLRCQDAPYLLIVSGSDRQPELTFVYDRARDALVQIGASHPEIHAREMGIRSFDRFKARDGLSIPVYVTRPPKATGPTATVVMVHGGPYVHGTEWGWEPAAQFLAARGYTVIEPAFRGSTGYGNTLFMGGMQQWGLAMQDDLADAAKWAVKQGYADASRIAIGGASYGGYATLMGLIRDPTLFRAGFEWVGVTDLDLLFSLRSSSDLSDETLGYTLPELIGDPATHKAQFAATSPLKRAAEIHQPVLLAYGGMDRRVPVTHGQSFRTALAATNPDVEWAFYPEEGHGWFFLETNRDFWTRVEKFLARTLAPAPAN